MANRKDKKRRLRNMTTFHKVVNYSDFVRGTWRDVVMTPSPVHNALVRCPKCSQRVLLFTYQISSHGMTDPGFQCPRCSYKELMTALNDWEGEYLMTSQGFNQVGAGLIVFSSYNQNNDVDELYLGSPYHVVQVKYA